MVTDMLHCRKDDDEQVLIRPVSARPWGGDQFRRVHGGDHAGAHSAASALGYVDELVVVVFPLIVSNAAVG